MTPRLVMFDHGTAHLQTSCTVTITPTTNLNTILIIGIRWSGTTLTGVTFDGGTAGLVGTLQQDNANSTGCSMYYVLSPSLSTHTVVASSASNQNWSVDLVLYSGVNQVNPVGTPQKNGSVSTSSISCSLTTSVGDLCVDTVGAGYGGGGTSISVNAGQTQVYQDPTEMWGADSYIMATSTPTSIGWTLGGGANWMAQVAIPLHPAFQGGQGASLSPNYLF